MLRVCIWIAVLLAAGVQAAAAKDIWYIDHTQAGSVFFVDASTIYRSADGYWHGTVWTYEEPPIDSVRYFRYDWTVDCARDRYLTVRTDLYDVNEAFETGDTKKTPFRTPPADSGNMEAVKFICGTRNNWNYRIGEKSLGDVAQYELSQK
jgi:hypothetical protein